MSICIMLLHSIKNFFAMGGYAIYVWPVYIIAIVILLTFLITACRQQYRIVRDVARKIISYDESNS